MKILEASFPGREYEHIAADSEEFLDRKKQIQELLRELGEKIQDDFFGQRSLGIIDKYFKIIDILEKLEDCPERDQIDHYLGLIREQLDIVRHKLNNISNNDFDWYSSFFLVVTREQNPEITSNDVIYSKATKVAIDFLMHPEEMDYDTLLGMLDTYRQFFNKRSEELQANVPEFVSKFKNAVTAASTEGLINIPEERLENRMSTINVSMVDRHKRGSDCPDGICNSDGVIMIYLNPHSKRSLNHVLNHEGLHALSGATYIKKNGKEKKDTRYINQRMGLSFSDVERRDVFTWLNEAVTEELNQRIFKYGKSDDTYILERQALKKMVKDGVPEQLVFDAYFEDYDPDDPDRVPKWKALVAKINEVYPNGLQHLKEVGDEIKKEEDRIKKEKIAKLKSDAMPKTKK